MTREERIKELFSKALEAETPAAQKALRFAFEVSFGAYFAYKAAYG